MLTMHGANMKSPKTVAAVIHRILIHCHVCIMICT